MCAPLFFQHSQKNTNLKVISFFQKTQYKGINLDQWKSIFEFSVKVDADFFPYDPDLGECTQRHKGFLFLDFDFLFVLQGLCSLMILWNGRGERGWSSQRRPCEMRKMIRMRSRGIFLTLLSDVIVIFIYK